MKKRTRSLRHQMGHIMTNAKAFGQSKRSYRKQMRKNLIKFFLILITIV